MYNTIYIFNKLIFSYPKCHFHHSIGSYIYVSNNSWSTNVYGTPCMPILIWGHFSYIFLAHNRSSYRHILYNNSNQGQGLKLGMCFWLTKCVIHNMFISKFMGELRRIYQIAGIPYFNMHLFCINGRSFKATVSPFS